MVIRRTKKMWKKRGSRVMGYGRISGGHRASGQRGGVGVGTGNFKHHQVLALSLRMIGPRHYRLLNRGFIRHESIQDNYESWNINTLNNFLSTSAGSQYSVGDKYVVNLGDFGIHKLLGKGTLNFKVDVTVDRATTKAKKKIESAKGKITELNPKSEEAEGEAKAKAKPETKEEKPKPKPRAKKAKATSEAKTE